MSEPFEPTPPEGCRIRQTGEEVDSADLWWCDHRKEWRRVNPKASRVAVLNYERIATKEQP